MLSNLPWVTQKAKLPGAQARFRWQLAGAGFPGLPQGGHFSEWNFLSAQPLFPWARWAVLSMS